MDRMTDVAAPKPRKERKANADKRRRQLLDAARRSILIHGLSKTTLATVAGEAGLSQGVAVFYFKSKNGLLTETLRDLYRSYESLWREVIDSVGDPKDQLRALIEVDFSEQACGSDVLPLWFAFWGELRFSAHYAEVAEDFDNRRRLALVDVWTRALPDGQGARAAQYAEWMETLSDGYWQHLHLAPASGDRVQMAKDLRACLAGLVPEFGGSF